MNKHIITTTTTVYRKNRNCRIMEGPSVKTQRCKDYSAASDAMQREFNWDRIATARPTIFPEHTDRMPAAEMEIKGSEWVDGGPIDTLTVVRIEWQRPEEWLRDWGY